MKGSGGDLGGLKIFGLVLEDCTGVWELQLVQPLLHIRKGP